MDNEKRKEKERKWNSSEGAKKARAKYAKSDKGKALERKIKCCRCQQETTFESSLINGWYKIGLGKWICLECNSIRREALGYQGFV